MPWPPELFTAPVLEHLLEKQERGRLQVVPFYEGLLAGEPAALEEAFAGEPEIHHPVRGRIVGAGPFEAFLAEERAWLAERRASVEDVSLVPARPRGFGEVVLHLDGPEGRVDLPVAIVSDHQADGRLEEVRLYFSRWTLTGRHADRPPLLQRDPDLRLPDVIAEHQRALAAGDVDAVVATFESGGYAREPAGADHLHAGSDALRGFYEHLFSNGGGVGLEHCGLADDGRTCALEYNVVRWGRSDLAPQAGAAVYARGEGGRLAAARMYDDTDPPLALRTGSS
jgi:hypothetical protein